MKNERARRRLKIAQRIARDISPGAVVNLGIGLPTDVANHIPSDKKVLFHSENGFIGLGALRPREHRDPDIVNAGGEPVAIVPGASFFDSALSFAAIRGGHLDVVVLGALEVDQEGNLANYMLPGMTGPGMGGAMDLAGGAKKVIIATEHVTKFGTSKIRKRCTLPLTGRKVVDVIVTDLAFIRVTRKGLVLEEVAEYATVEEVLQKTEADLTVAPNVAEF